MRRLPDAVKQQRGTLRPCRVNKNKSVGFDLPMPPETLNPESHQLWYSITSTLAKNGQYSPNFAALIEAFCNEKWKYDWATKELRNDGDLISETNDGKTVTRSPYIVIQDKCLDNMLSISKRFGFDLLSMEALGTKSDVPKDPLEDL